MINSDQSNDQESEVVLSPRERVMAAIKKQDEINHELNSLANQQVDRTISPRTRQIREKPWIDKKKAQKLEFENLISNEPEARAYDQIAREELRRTMRDFGPQTSHGDATGDAAARVNVLIAQSTASGARENLTRVLGKIGKTGIPKLVPSHV